MFTGKVVKTFKDKHTRKIHRKGSEYSHKDESRLQELAKLGFVKYGKTQSEKGKKAEANNKAEKK